MTTHADLTARVDFLPEQRRPAEQHYYAESDALLDAAGITDWLSDACSGEVVGNVPYFRSDLDALKWCDGAPLHSLFAAMFEEGAAYPLIALAELRRRWLINAQRFITAGSRAEDAESYHRELAADARQEERVL